MGKKSMSHIRFPSDTSSFPCHQEAVSSNPGMCGFASSTSKWPGWMVRRSVMKEASPLNLEGEKYHISGSTGQILENRPVFLFTVKLRLRSPQIKTGTLCKQADQSACAPTNQNKTRSLLRSTALSNSNSEFESRPGWPSEPNAAQHTVLGGDFEQFP